ncbi:uncharacterized protein N7479_007997 [Penicillium vulpinum]|uniref:Uncharacterized protein n=1 Tax=Penicillium vulpinum TaxID=29845 RepID=A0A1V6RME1_9EURO|nr:uncharacterized protein N7479_007997 [Penicillium vulpinum]KAJ5960847.1 hypothetical protein N7479_007997 [Penicillium vulpinum]OQE02718.1 hypothetical protein PENVUL_c039G09358 [Penicillium vulpinum]
MQNNVLIGVLLAVAVVIPVFGWLFYLWYRSYLIKMHQEGQAFDRRDRDRAQANYGPADGAQPPVAGPYFTSRGWVRPKTRGPSHALRPTPQYIHPGQPIFTGIPHSDQHFQGPNQANIHSPRKMNQPPNQLSKRQQRKQRALQNKQKRQQQIGQQQSQNEEKNQHNQQNQRKQKNKNKARNHQKSPNAQSPNAQSPKAQSPKSQWGQAQLYHQRGNTEGQDDQTSNHGKDGWGNDGKSWDNQHYTGQNDNNDHLGNTHNNDQGGQRNSGSRSPRQYSRDNEKDYDQSQDNNSPRQRRSRWDKKPQDDHRYSNERGRGNHEEQHLQHESYNNRPASPDQASRNEVESRRGWGQSDDDAQQDSRSRSNHSNYDDCNNYDGWGDDDAKSYHKKNKRNHRVSLERKSRGRSSPNREWGHEEHRGGGSDSWSQDGNVHRDKRKKEKKERWQIELEENEKRRRGRSPSRGGSDAGWDKRSQVSGWKETQKW